MTRVKRGKSHLKHRNNILKRAKGYMWGRKNLIKLAKTAIARAGNFARRDRRINKRRARTLWNIKINAGLHILNWSYSKFIGALNKKNIKLNRKVLSELADNNKVIFDKIVEAVK